MRQPQEKKDQRLEVLPGAERNESRLGAWKAAGYHKAAEDFYGSAR